MLIIRPQVGTVCKFVFTTPFASLNGVYKIDQVITFDRVQLDDIDLIELLYKPAGRTAADFDNEWETFKNNQVLKLIDVTDETGDTFIYTPEAIIDTVPDPMIKQYHDLYFGISVGPYLSPTDVSYLVTLINDIVQTSTGNADTVKLFSRAKVWLTDAQFQAIQDTRAASQDTIKTLTQQLAEKDAMIQRQATLIAEYEQTLVLLAEP